MKKELSVEESEQRIKELEGRLEEADQLIEAIKAGEVDAFALNRNDKAEIFTIQSGDYGYRMLVENFGEGALTLSEDALIVYTNNYFPELLKVSYDGVIGRSVFNFIHPDCKEAFNELFKKGLAGQSKGEINLYFGNRIIPVYVSLTSLYPTLPTVGMIVTDLTEKRKQEELLLEQNRSLETMNEQLQLMNKELESFTYISSHDLQEPLRKIQTFASLVLEKESQNLSDTGKDLFHRMQMSAKRMQRLIDDLLVYSRTNTSDRKFETADLGKIIEEVKEELKEEIEEKHATIEAGEVCDASIIPFQFRQMLHNLIGNSLKFAKPGIPPHIKIRSSVERGIKLNYEKLQPQNKYCHITVSDNGIGFEQQYSEKIFEVFQRLHSKVEYNGTGIGLSIVKKIVENHNGVITAQGELNKGTTFDIYIPVV